MPLEIFFGEKLVCVCVDIFDTTPQRHKEGRFFINALLVLFSLSLSLSLSPESHFVKLS